MTGREQKKPVLIRLPASLHKELVALSALETARRGATVSVQKVMEEKLMKAVMPKGGKLHG